MIAIVVGGAGCPTPDVTPPGAVSGFTATAGDALVVLVWTNPGDADLAGIKIQRKVDSAPASPTDGATVFNAMGTGYADTGVTNGTTYYYSAFAYDGAGNFAPAAQAGATPTSASARGDVLEGIADLDALVLASPLGPNEQAALAAKLHDAEMLYRGGDLCGSGEALIGYMQTAQDLRMGTMVETVEGLYNIGSMILFNMYAGLLLKDQCPGQERFGMEADAMVDTENNARLSALAELGKPMVATVHANEEVFTEVQIPGADTSGGVPGEPGIPVFRRLIAVPRGASVEAKITTEGAETIKLNLFPTQTSPVDAVEDPFGNKPFIKNEDRYQTDAFFPADDDIVTLTEVGSMRDVRMVLAEVAAGQYNPVTDVLRLFKNVQFDVSFTGGSGAFLTDASLNPFDDSPRLAAAAVLNRASISRYAEIGPIVRIYGEELLILTPPDLRAAADTLAAWKREKGILTKVINVMGDTVYDTAQEIDDLIKNEYDSVIIRPSYVLLFGDADKIPTFYPAALTDVGTPTIGSDWQYAILGDPGVDNIPDFAVGRIPVDTLDQANTVVTKIINYEKTPPATLSFYSNASITAQFQCCRTDVTQPGTDKRSFIEVSEFARNVLVGQGKTVERIYTETGTATPRRYYDGALLPAALGPGYAWAGTGNDIVNAFNAGRFLIIHRDHGGPDQWVNPYFDLTRVPDLVNGAWQPVVFSVNCASGLWDNETAPGALGTTTTGVYMAEQLLRKADGGAVGILGDTRNSPSWANSALLRGYMDAIWPTAIPTYGDSASKRRLGDILNHGKMYMLTQAGVGGTMISSYEGADELRLWHAIGDPTLEIWTHSPYLIVLPRWIVVRPLLYALNVEYPIDGAIITVFQDQGGNFGLAPIGRGTVHDGVANIPFFQKPVEGYPFEFHASLENAIAKLVTIP
jgi:hypothetical protein